MAGTIEISTLNLTSPNGLVTKPITLDNSGNALFNGEQIANTSSIETQLSTKAPLESPTFTGLITTGGQIKFPATQVPSSDANTLDDYEEGTWTPAVAFGGSTTGITYSVQNGRYVKIGKRVFLDGTINLSNKGSATGYANLIGTPFASESIADFFPNIPCQAFGLDTTRQISLQVNYGSVIFLVLNGADTAITNSNFTNTTVLRFSFSYTV